MKSFVGSPIFTAAERTYFWEDVVVAAWRWNEWRELEERTRAAIACRRRLDERPEALKREEVATAAKDYRYQRGLLSGDETKAWLERWGLTVDVWMEYVRRSVIRERWEADLAAIVASHPVEVAEVEQLIWVEAFCSGRLERWAHKLAERAAVYDPLESHQPAAQRIDLDSDANGRRPPLGVPLDIWKKASERVAPLDDAYRRFVERAVPPAEISKQIAAHRLEWLSVEFESIVFPSEEMACEALLSVREDRRPMPDVAADAGTDVALARCYLDEAPPLMARSLHSAAVHDVLGPFSLDDGFHVVRVLAKVYPSPSDAAVRERAERVVAGDRLRRELRSRIRWHEHL